MEPPAGAVRKSPGLSLFIGATVRTDVPVIHFAAGETMNDVPHKRRWVRRKQHRLARTGQGKNG